MQNWIKDIINRVVVAYRNMVFENAVAKAELLHKRFARRVFVMSTEFGELEFTTLDQYRNSRGQRAGDESMLLKRSIYYSANRDGKEVMSERQIKTRRIKYVIAFMR